MGTLLGYPSGGDRQAIPLGSSLLLHALLLAAVLGGAHFPGRKVVTIPVAYEVRLVTLPSPSVSAPPAPSPSSPAKSPVPPPPSEELSLPGKRTAPVGEVPSESLTLTPRPARRAISPEAPPAVPTVPSPVARSAGPAPAPEGAVSVENADPRLANYRVLLEYKISSTWIPPRVRTGHSPPVVSFKIMRNGQVKDVRLEISSGNRGMDDSALRAIHLAKPFPPLPALFQDEFASVQTHFNLEGETR